MSKGYKPIMGDEGSFSPSHESLGASADKEHSYLRSHERSSVDSDDELDPLHDHDGPYRDKILPETIRAYFDNSTLLSRTRAGQWSLPSRRSCCCAILGVFGLILLLLSGGGYWAVKVGGVPPDGQSEPWYPAPRGGTVPEWEEAYKKAFELVRQMTLVEKVNITTGTGWMMGPCVGNTGSVPRLNFPALCLQDGPLGLRFTDHTTAFPAGITVGATWNKTAMYLRGRAHALEARGKGINNILGPAMGPLGKLPAGGRNWEGFGPDPVLSGIAAYQTIKGIQDQGVMATAKHYIANEQEHYRQTWEWGTPAAISSNIDDRTLHELYAWPFADSVRAGVASVMCSYNQVNNSYACQNSKLLNGILKDELGFQGFVQSDWLAQRSGVGAALAGLDMSMPGDGIVWANGKPLWGSELTKAVLNKTVPLERLDDMVLRIVASWYQVGQDDTDLWPRDGHVLTPNFSSWTKNETGLLFPGSDDGSKGVVNKFVDVSADHHTLAREVAEEGIVLVKNENGMLPLQKDGYQMTQVPGRKLRVGVFGEDGFDNPQGPNSCEDRACNEYTLGSGWGSGAVDFPYLISPVTALKKSFVPESVELFEWPSNDISSKMDKLAQTSDICLVFVSSDGGEGFKSWQDVKGDRADLYAQKNGDALVKRVASKCGNNGHGPVVVILHAVGPVILENWIDHPNIHAVLLAHLPGQESGHALSSVLFGDVNPSGRLPYTVGRRESDYGAYSQILRSTKSLVPQQNFTDRMYIDYRHFDAHDIKPRYEFGYGLSYTTFSISGIMAFSLVPERKPFPGPRAEAVAPPKTDLRLPPAKSALKPRDFVPVNKFIYPYLESEGEAKPHGIYPYPRGYKKLRPPSLAGGSQGGNSDLWAPVAQVSAVLKNEGSREGAQTVQVYVSFPANVTDSQGRAVDFPPRQLRAFDKIRLQPGEEKRFELELTRRDVSYWDVGVQNWVWPMKGTFRVAVGFSSRDVVELEVPWIEGNGKWESGRWVMPWDEGQIEGNGMGM